MTLKTILAAGVVALSASGAANAETVMLPGLYETKVGYPGQGGVETTRDCLTPDEVKTETIERRLAQAVKDPSCKFSSRSFGGGKFAIAGSCNNGGIRSSFKQSGTYSPTTLNMNMSMTMIPTPGAKPVAMNLVTASRRIAATCPAGTGDE